ncbi:PAS domain S-box-containing protein [Hymenobacter daecheongensis DSM 21074]|uniref:histidine kinase n=1 Tax=Hymenobacter daecheongensis DSM 21074 TaxID=1121955 RepID=A0A1M6FAZ5_9BACT|nr:PAS domain-containing protein [Hymenobacter daecheongensis]SHI94870.1 PAS domain S-box-containing protein [Hymenobacter daecheongensis DSM 21074]
MPAFTDTISYDHLQTAVAAAGIGTWDLNVTTGELVWSERCKELFGLPADAHIDYPRFLERLHPDDRAATEAAVQQALSPAGVGLFDIEYRTAPPTAGAAQPTRWIRATGRAFFDADHTQALRLIGTVADVTTAKTAALRFQLLADNVPVTIVVADAAGQIQYANQQLLDYTGLTQQELAQHWATLIHPDDLSAAAGTWARALQTGEPYELEYRLRRADGEYRWMLSITRPSLGPDGRPSLWVSSSLDIHERRATTHNLAQLLASNLIGIIFWDLDNPLVMDANDQYLSIIGYSREELRAGLINWQTMTPPEFAALDEQATAELDRTGTHRPYEKEYVHKDGRRVAVLLGGSFTEPGTTRKGISFCLDITAQKEAQRLADVREREFSAMANSISQLAWMAEPDGHIFWYNARWYEYTGTTLEEMVGWGWSKVHHPDHIERVLTAVKEWWSVPEPFELTFPLRGRDGQYRWFLTRAVPILDEHGAILRWFGTNTDVTQMRQLQDQLERSYQDLELKVTFRTLQLEQQVQELQAQLAALKAK